METRTKVTTEYIPGKTYDDLEVTRVAATNDQPEYAFGDEGEYGVPLGIGYLREVHTQLSSSATWDKRHNMSAESWD